MPSGDDQEREERFDELYRLYFARVYAYVLRRGSREAAHDVVAETFLVAWRRLERLPDDPLPWLLGIARKTLSNERRGNQRRFRLAERLETETAQTHDDHEPHTELELTEITNALEQLPEQDVELLRLVAWEGLTVVEAARVLGNSAATCRVRLHRARRRLARELSRIHQAQEPLLPTPKEQL